MKIWLTLFIYFFTITCFAESPTSLSLLQKDALLSNCGRAVPTSDPSFCASFKAIAYCHCHDEHGMPPTACSDMHRLLQIMISTYGSLWNACSPAAQRDVPQQECYDDWNYYNSHC